MSRWCLCTGSFTWWENMFSVSFSLREFCQELSSVRQHAAVNIRMPPMGRVSRWILEIKPPKKPFKESFRKRSALRLRFSCVWLQREEQQSSFLMTGVKCLFPQLILVYLEPRAARMALISDQIRRSSFPSQVNKSHPDHSRDGRGRRRR